MRTCIPMAISLLTLALAPAAAGQGAPEMVVYRRGAAQEVDPKVGRALEEIVLETYSGIDGSLKNKETFHNYFHWAKDKELVNPEQLCDAWRKHFVIEERNYVYFFVSVREQELKAASEIAKATLEAPTPTAEVVATTLRARTRRVARAISQVDPSAKGSRELRERIINNEFTLGLGKLDDEQLQTVATTVSKDGSMTLGSKYYVLRSFGFALYRHKSFDAAVFFYNRAIEEAPDNYSGHLQKAVALQHMKAPERALPVFCEALYHSCGRSARSARTVIKYLKAYLARETDNPYLNPERYAELKAGLAAIGHELATRRHVEARAGADRLRTLVGSWYPASSEDQAGGERSQSDDTTKAAGDGGP